MNNSTYTDNISHQKQNKTIFGILAVCIAAAAWGVDGVLLTPNLMNKSGYPLDASYVVWTVHLIPFILMNFIFYKYYKLLRSFTISDFAYLFGVAFFGGALGTLCIVKALFLVNFQNLTIITLLQKLQPIFAIALSVLILKETISKNYYLWAIIALASGYIMTFGFNLPKAVGDNVIQASLYALLAAFSFGSSTVFSKKLLIKYSVNCITFFRYGMTTVIAFFFVLVNHSLSEIYNTPIKSWILFIIIAFTTGSGAMFLYYYGLKKVKASISTICELFFPITAAILDTIFNNNNMSVVQWVAAAIMIFAIIKLSSNKKE